MDGSSRLEKENLAPTPWLITKRKRTGTSSAPPLRKHPRAGHTPSASTIRQQTLTQAQWVTSAPASFVEDADLRPIELMPRRMPAQKSSKRDSTLTQMAFFNRALLQLDEMDTAPLPAPEHEPHHPHPMLQVDGAYDSPRKPRKRKSSMTPGPYHIVKRPRQSQGSRQYRPSSRGQNTNEISDEAQPRRTSRRLADRATILSDPAENFDYFEKALSQSPSRDTFKQPQEQLEIQDSTATEEDAKQLRRQPQPSEIAEYPSTPKRWPAVIPSSQSPSSVPPSTREKAEKSENDLEHYPRSPLRGRSVNLPPPPPAVPSSSNATTSKSNADDEAKVATSRLSKRRPAVLKTRVEDSQANLWSFPETSSPQKTRTSQPFVATHGQPPKPNPKVKDFEEAAEEPRNISDGLEIPSTSQVVGLLSSSPNVESQDTLSSLHRLIGVPDPPPAANSLENDALTEAGRADSGVVVRDFAGCSTIVPRLLQGAEDKNKVSHEDVQDEPDKIGDSESYFGSPIANDTQFNVDTGHRTSSPSRSPSQASRSQLDVSHAQQAPDIQHQLTGVHNVEATTSTRNVSSPVPTPRLLSPSSPYADTVNPPNTGSGLDEFLLPQFPHTSITQVFMTRIPLNDVQLPSSLRAVPSSRSITQRSVHPASMPHPSQISTQEATQAYLGQSSLTAPEQDAETPRGTEKITIKDSSSMKVLMSQISAYTVSQAQASVDLGLDDLDTDDDGDDDLNPPSSNPQPPERHSTPHRSRSPVKAAECALANTPPRAATHSSQYDDNPEPSPSRVQATQAADPFPSSPSSSHSSPIHSPLRRKYTPIPGFNNETQANFTQNGHVTAAYIHRQREKGVLPKWYVPKPYQVPGYTRR